MDRDNPPEGQAEFDSIYHAHHAAVQRHLLYLLGDTRIAEDLTQETFGRLYQRDLSESASRSVPAADLQNPLAWLLTVASNLAYNYFRSETRRHAHETAADLAVASPPSPNLDDILDVRTALDSLEARDRIVLMLRHSGFSYAEIGQAVGVASSSVGTILARSQRRFREAYEGAGSGADKKE